MNVVVEPKGVFCLPPDMVLIQIAPKTSSWDYILSEESQEYLDFCIVVLLDKLSKNDGFPDQMKVNSKL